MNNLEFIDSEINYCKAEIHMCTMKYDYGILKEFYYKQDVEKYQKRINTLQQIKKELELVELIKIGCTGVKYNSDGGSVIKLGNINAMNFIKLFNILDEICDWEEEDAEN